MSIASIFRNAPKPFINILRRLKQIKWIFFLPSSNLLFYLSFLGLCLAFSEAKLFFCNLLSVYNMSLCADGGSVWSYRHFKSNSWNYEPWFSWDIFDHQHAPVDIHPRWHFLALQFVWTCRSFWLLQRNQRFFRHWSWVALAEVSDYFNGIECWKVER